MNAITLRELTEMEFGEDDWIHVLQQLLIKLEEAKREGDKPSARIYRHEIRMLTDEAQTFLPLD